MDSDHDSDTSNDSGAPPPKKRAAPFSRAELIYIVQFMEERGYGAAAKGSINNQKAQILHDLAEELESKFGIRHSERQIQKRYSDLKVREKETYEGIRRKIARDKAKEQASVSTPPEPLVTAGEEIGLGTSVNQTECPNAEEFFTLTLEPIPPEAPMEMGQPSSLPDIISSQLTEMETRLKDHFSHNLNLLAQKCDALCDKADKRFAVLEKAVSDLTQKSILIDN